MLPLLEAYWLCLERVHQDIQRALEGVSPKGLDWTPGPETNSLAVLIAHVTGSERYWVGEVAGEDPAHRDRPAEFQTSGIAGVALLAGLDASLAHSRATLERLSLADLAAKRLDRDGDEITVARALFHNLQHLALHAGQMQLTRQMWENKAD